ncbi:glomulin [Neocloeon triangulifer]|uniref:glomulin n=1 Tax=Neocloeon triangulifer TaxID=2078957 RepID=UPI00286F00E0|nr:glomulin [Neocloeon triangulifer]
MDDSTFPPTTDPSLIKLQELLSKGDLNEAKDFFFGPEIAEKTLKSPMDVIRTLVTFVSPRQKCSNPSLVDTCQLMLESVAENVADPDEIYLELLSNMDDKENPVLLIIILKCVEICLAKMSSSKTRALDWCLATLRDTLDDLPSDVDLTEIYPEIEKFFQKCIADLDVGNEKDCEEQKQCLATFLLTQLVHTSLPEDTLVGFVHSLTKVLPHFGHPLKYLSEKGGWKKNKTDNHHFLDEVPLSASFEMLYYYVIHKGIGYDFFPQVYSPQFLFVQLGALCSELVANGDRDLQEKGLKMLIDVLDRVDPGSITHHALSANHYPNLLKGLCNMMVYCSNEDTRIKAAATFKRLMYVFDERGRHLILLHGYRTLEEQGVRGYMVTISKDFVTEYLKSGNYFMQNLPELLNRMFVLPQGEKTLLFDWIDTVVSKLNLLRYIVMADPKPGAFTGIWDIEIDINERFLKPLSDALKYSREYLNDRMNDAQILSNTHPTGSTVQVGGETLPAPNYEEEVGGIKLKLTQLDFVQHIYEIVIEKFV